MANRLTIDAFKRPVFRGKKYRKIKTFFKESKADEYALELEDVCPSQRFPPLVQRVAIGLGLGYVYRVCVPCDVKLDKQKLRS